MAQAESKQEARFEALVGRAEKGGLDFDQLRELSHLYRVHSTRLSQQRSARIDPEAVRYLNSLCVRAAGHLYVPPTRLPSAARFWMRDLPRVLARTWKLQLLSAGLVLLGALIGARLAFEDAANLGATVPTGMYDAANLQRLYESPQARAAFLARKDVGDAQHALFAGALFSNNTRVGMLAFATGILFCIPTLCLLLYNGLNLGAFSVIFLRSESAGPFLAWLVPHGIPEILAIVLCGAGGLVIGLAAIAPGRRGRARALKEAAHDAFLLLGVSVPLFVIAAFIESYIRESLLSTFGRALVASASVASLLGYVGLIAWAERRRRRVTVDHLLQQGAA